MELSNKQKDLLRQLVIDSVNHLNIVENSCISPLDDNLKRLEKESNVVFLLKIKELNLKREQYPLVIRYLENYGDYLEPELIDDLVYKEGTNLVVDRILNAIRYDLIYNMDYFELDKTLLGNTSTIDNSFNYYFNDLASYMQSKLSIENDLYTIFISTIEDEIVNPYNKDIINNLIRAKYKLLYLNPNFEDIYNYHHDTTYLSSKLVSDHLFIENDEYNEILLSYCFDIIEYSLTELLFYDDKDLENQDLKTIIILRLKLILSSLTLVGEVLCNEVLSNFEEEIENFTSLSIKALLNEIFIDYKNEINKYKILSLK